MTSTWVATPRQLTCRFAHVLPLEYVHQNNIYFVRVLLVIGANGRIGVAGRPIFSKVNLTEFTVSRIAYLAGS